MNIKPGTIIGGRYTIAEKIGIGGMAVVYKAKDEKLDRFVTFKVLKEEYVSDEEFIKRFNIEARAAARLSHPNIVNVYDVGNDNLVYYIVMEYIDGFTLKELIKRKAPLMNEEALGVAIQIASALEVAHKNNIVHRDIKPQNILVTRDGTIKVTDFGIARAATSKTMTVESMGSVHYFSPEQARGGFVDSKSDIYSLGIVLFEMVTGKLPFEGDTAVVLAMKHINDPLPDMKEINPRISESLERIILKSTQKISSKRYQNIEEFNMDLKRALTNESGDFVKSHDESFDSPTVRITSEEIEEIKKQSRLHDDSYQTEEIYEDDVYDDMYEDDYTEDYGSDYNELPEDELPVQGDEYYDKKKEKKVIIAAIVTAIAIIALITSIGTYFINKNINTEVNMPNFKGRTWDEAIKMAAGFKIYINKEGEDYSDEYEKDEIMQQDKEQGTTVKPGDTVNVVISLGSDKVTVPSVLNEEAVKASEELSSKYELRVKEEYINDEEVPIGYVAKQDPKEGTKISKGDTITIYVSKGKKESKVIVPNVVGRTETQAKTLIEKADLVVGNILYAPSTKYEKGYVIKQGVTAGEQVMSGYIVNLVLSSGKEEDTTKEQTTETTTKETETKEQETKETTKETTTIETETKETTTETETKEQETKEAPMKKEVLTINPSIPEGSETVRVRILKKTDSSTNEEIYSREHSASDFPLNVTVSGNKPTEFQLYINDEIEGTETRDFQ